MKKIISLFLAMMLVAGVFIQTPVLAAECNLDEISDVQQGESIIVNGTAQGANYYVILYLKNPNGEAVMTDVLPVNNGNFVKKIVIPFSWGAGVYTAVAGFGTTTSVRQFNVTSVGEFVGIDDLSYSIDQYSDLTLPDKITAEYENSEAVFENPSYIWENELNTNKAGNYTATGKITDMYGTERTFNVFVYVRPVKIEKILTKLADVEVEEGGSIVLPEYVTVSLSNNKSKALKVNWTPNPDSVDTTLGNEITFTGKIDEYDGNITLKSTVIPYSEDIPRYGLFLWSEADYSDIQADEQGRVSTWKDKSGKGNDLQSISDSNSPQIEENSVNGHMSLAFKNAAMKTKATEKYSGESTVFIVSKLNSASKNGGIFTTSTEGAQESDIDLQVKDGMVVAASNSGLGSSESTVWYGGTAPNTSSFHIAGMRVNEEKREGVWNKSIIDTYYDTSASSAAYSTSNGSCAYNTHYGYVIGGRGTGNKNFSDINVCEVIVYRRALTDSEINRVRGYLNDKYLVKSKYNVSAFAAVSGENLIVRSNITNGSSKQVDDAELIQIVGSGEIADMYLLSDIKELGSLSGTSVRNSVAWSGEAPEAKAILFKDFESMTPMAVSDFDGYISDAEGTEKIGIGGVTVMNDTVQVSGNLPSGSNKKVLLVTADTAENITSDNIYNAGMTETDESGDFTYTFKLPDSDKNGSVINKKMYLLVGGELSKRADIKDFGYAGKTLREQIFNSLKTATQSSVSEMLKEGSDKRNALNSLGIQIDVYDMLDTKGKEDYISNLLRAASGISGSGENAIAEFAAQMQKSYPIIELNSSASAADTLKTLEKYPQELGYKPEGTERNGFISNYVFANMPYSSMDSYNAVYAKADIFYNINNSNYVDFSELISDNEALMSASAQYSYYKTVSANEKQSINKYIITQISKSKIYTANALCDLMDNAVISYRNSLNKVSAGGGGAGGGGKNSVSAPSVLGLNPQNDTSSDTFAGFTDLQNVVWAQEAINVLKAKNIVNGKTESEFYPMDTVTREEFVKMLTAACNISPEGECEFDDCDKSQWYYPYIAAAVKSGIVNGISETEFGIGRQITRAQMAVMCERAVTALGMKLDEVNDAAEFADSELIPGYAEESIRVMQRAGIINGRDGGIFDPLGFATRAEAAKVIYSVLKKM
ncbi:MAG: S-layer homology domain-containing protein [Clostridia bacterium]|nr:S-layer homology domain-containing protein [Clostridia bacterium]